MSELTPRPSYRALFAVPQLGRVVASMQLARIAQSMLGVAIVLFALAEYDSPSLAGIVTFASIVPGLLIAPIAGALLDRHGRIRLIGLDYAVAFASLILIGCLSLAGMLPVGLLIVIVMITSLTAILSHVGLRTIIPLIVPSQLWERANAIDANGYVVATILGPPIAAAAVAVLGPPVAMITIAIPFGLAALALIGLREPAMVGAAPGNLLRDAWDGTRYAWRNRTIRGLGFSISVTNLSWGMMTIAIPLIVLDALELDAIWVGVVFAVSGVSGMISALVFGRGDSRGRELPMIVIPTLLLAPAVALLLPTTGLFGPIEPAAGLALLIDRDDADRAAERSDRHRPVHRPPAPDGCRMDGPCVRRLDGVQLHRLSVRGGDRRRAGDRFARRRPSPWGSSPAWREGYWRSG